MVYMAPYHLYHHALSEGLETPFFTAEKIKPQYLKGQKFNNKKMNIVVSDNNNLWEEFHFSNMNIVFPINHPQILTIPKIEFRSYGVSLGMKFLDQRKKKIAEFMLGSSEKLNLNPSKQKIFDLPLVKNFIRKKNVKDIWRDLFIKDLSLPQIDMEDTTIDYLKSVSNISYKELAYRLFIMELRNKIFSKNLTKIQYDANKGFGVAELRINNKSEENYTHEVIYIPEKGRIYKVHLKYLRDNVVAESLRRRLYDHLKFIKRSEDSSRSIYARHKTLTFEERTSQEGLVYMFSAWSHVPKSESFLKEMIHFLERGDDTIFYLTPLYNFAYKRFGSTFSSRDEKLLEEQRQFLERKTKEELLKEIDREQKRDFVDEEGDFINDDAKVNFFLRKGKLGEKTVDENVLTVD